MLSYSLVAPVLLSYSPGLRVAAPATFRAQLRCASMQLPDFMKDAGKMGGDFMKSAGLGGDDDSPEAKEMEERLKQGKMSFDDFLKQVQVMQKAGSVASFMQNGPFGQQNMNKEQLDEGQKKLKRYSEFCQVMEADERGDPSILVAEAESLRTGGAATRLSRIADASGASVENVAQFVYEFKVMSGAAVRFANGESPEAIKASMMEEQQKGPGGPQNRAQRRKAAQKMKKVKKSATGFGR